MFSIAILGTILGYGIVIPLLILSRITGSQHLSRAGLWVTQKGIRLLMACQPWYHAHVELPNAYPEAQDRPVLRVGNHRSNLDMFILLSRIQGLRALTKRTVLWVPVLTPMVLILRQILVSRGNQQSYLEAMEELRKGLLSFESVFVFPEMTRCEPGSKGVGPFHLQPFSVARSARALIAPVVFIGTDAVLPKGSIGIRSEHHVIVKSLPLIDSTSFSSVSALKDHVQDVLNREIRALST